MTITPIRVTTSEALTLNASRVAHVMRIGTAQLEKDVKSFIDEANRFDALGDQAVDPANKAQAHRGAENMRSMAREFQRYVDEAGDTILTIEAACEMQGGRLAVVVLNADELTDVIAAVTEMKGEA